MVVLIAKVSMAFSLTPSTYLHAVTVIKVSAFLCRAIRERAVITESEPDEGGATIVQMPDPEPIVPIIDSEMSIPAVEVDNDTQIPDFDFEKFLNDFGATPGSLGDGFISGPNTDANGIAAAALTPRFEDVLGNAPVPTPALDFGFNAGNLGAAEEATAPTLDQVKLAGLHAFFMDAKVLYTEIENWSDDVRLNDREARVLVGNQTHKLALMVSSPSYLWFPG